MSIGNLFNNNYGRLIKEIGKEVVDSIMIGRNDAHVLINSGGGIIRTVNFMGDMLRYANRDSGTVRTYATNIAASAAMGLFSLGDERYALHNTWLISHLSNYAVALPQNSTSLHASNADLTAMARARRQEMAGLYDFFCSNTHPNATEKAIAMIKDAELDPHNHDNVVYFKGRDLKDWGVVHQSFSSVKALQTHFLTTLGSDTFSKHDEVNAFFSVSHAIAGRTRRTPAPQLWRALRGLIEKHRREVGDR